MDIYFKALCGALAGVLICIILAKYSKDFSIASALILCVIICFSVTSFIKPILNLIERFSEFVDVSNIWMPILLKSAGIGFIGEIVSEICADAGFGVIGKTIQLLTTITILWLAIPLMEALMELIQQTLEFI